MPLKAGSSAKVVAANIRELHSGKQFARTAEKFGKEKADKQAVAIALNTARGRAWGGPVNWLPPIGGMMNSNQFPAMSSLPPYLYNLLNSGGMGGMSQGVAPPGFGFTPPRNMGLGAPPPTQFANMRSPAPQPMSYPPPQPQPSMSPPPMSPSPPVGLGDTTFQSSDGLTPIATPSPGIGVLPSGAPSPAPANMQLPGATPQQSPLPMAGSGMLARGGVANLDRAGGGQTGVGGFNMAKEAHMRPGFVEGSEMRKLTRGPILSAVSGRTDAHKAMVPASSYVIPADIVSGRGQGNTLAGMNVLQKMFKMGPFGTAMPQMHMGHTMPSPMKPPRAAAMLAKGGAGHDEHTGKLVPVNLAGGELVVPPEHLMATVHPNLKTAHEIMDRFVLAERKKLRKTLASLPGPAKD